MKAKKLPSGSYRIQVYLGLNEKGKKIIQSVTAPTEWEALKQAEELKQSKDLNYSDPTVYEAIDLYIQSRKNSLAPSTIRGYEIIRDSRLQLIRNVKCKELTKAHIQRAANEDALRLKRKSIKSALGLLKSALAMLDINISVGNVALPPAVYEETELPPVDEIIKLIIGTDVELPCLLAMWFSLRVSEIRGLQFRDIKDNGKYILVRRSKVYVNGKDIVREQTKTEKSTRKNRLPEYIYSLIKEIPHDSEDDFILPQSYHCITAHFRRIMRSNGIQITFHKLRHEFATTLNELSIPDEYIQKLGGWSTDKIMKSVYTIQDNQKKKSIRMLLIPILII